MRPVWEDGQGLWWTDAETLWAVQTHRTPLPRPLYCGPSEPDARSVLSFAREVPNGRPRLLRMDCRISRSAWVTIPTPTP